MLYAHKNTLLFAYMQTHALFIVLYPTGKYNKSMIFNVYHTLSFPQY